MASFTSVIKREICNLPLNSNCCIPAELLGVICFGAVIRNNRLSVKTESFTVAKRIQEMTSKVFGYNPNCIAGEGIKKKFYTVEIADDETLSDVLENFSLIKNSHDLKNFVSFGIEKRFVERLCCRQSFLRGAFLISGSCSSPEKAYHLEIATNHRRLSKEIADLLESLEISAKTIQRNSNYVIYLKDSDKIFDFLGLVGATTAMLEFQQAKIYKNFINNITRTMNCEEANLNKALKAGMEQAMGIEKIRDTIGLEKLEPSLREVALLRLENKSASLSELADMFSKPISRSGINHKLKKIERIAETIR